MSKLSFIEYLTEIMVDVDPNDPNASLKKTKMALQNPERFRKQQTSSNIDDQKEIQQKQDDPLKAEKLRIAKMKQRIINDEKRLSQNEIRAGKQAGINTGMGEQM